MEKTFQQKIHKIHNLSPAEAEELFVERMAELLIEQIRNGNGDQNGDQVKHPTQTLQ